MGSDQIFFKSTPLYKEYLLLEAVENNSKITQRELSRILSVSVSMINEYLDKEEKLGYLNKVYKSSKDVKYVITDRGKERVKLLNIQYLKSALTIYNQARRDITIFLYKIIKDGFKDVILYGAGDVSEIILQTLEFDQKLELNIVGIIDDDLGKQNTKLYNHQVMSLKDVSGIEHDGILISTYLHQQTIEAKLEEIHYNNKKIIRLF